MNKLAIIGAGGHGRVVADAAELNGWNQIEFFDDRWPEHQTNMIWPIVGNVADLFKRTTAFDGLIVALGDNQKRLAVSQQIIALGLPLVSIIHPKATVSRYAQLELGTVVFAGAIINFGTTIGIAAIINTGATIDHDCVLGQSVHISPGAHLAGGVEVGDLSWIGIGASVKQGIKIGRQVVIGAGAAVIKNFNDGKKAAGVPALEINKL